MILRAHAVSVGVSIGLSNLVTGTGYLGFFTLDSVLQFRGMVQTAFAERGAPRSVLSWCGGGALVSRDREDANEINAETIRLRGLIKQGLDQAGFRPVYARWLPADKCLNIALLCGTDECVMRVLDDPLTR